ncbi:transketolase [Streptomyces sp. NPDC102383]|uniref:transketolase n=1 Tax=Streptomyces sp. NPDC102383 TaxID=3366165 RepID=UPI0038154DDE
MGVTTVRAEDIYREELAGVGAEDGRVVCVEALLGSARHPFETAHPDRFFQLGSVESAMVTMVEGLVTAGFRVFVCGLGPTTNIGAARLPRLALAYLKAGASVVVPDAQVDPTELPRTPRVQIAEPCGVREIKAVVRGAARSGRPYYIRIGSGAPVDVASDWADRGDDIPSVVWDAGGGPARRVGGGVCLVSVGGDGTRLALEVRDRFESAAHGHLVYLDDSHLVAAAGELARHYDRFVVLGGDVGPAGVRQRLSELMPGCEVLGAPPQGELASDVAEVLLTLRRPRS